MGFVGVESEVERRAFAYLALGPHAAPVPCHDLPDAGQADTRAGELAGRMQPLERLEQRPGWQDPQFTGYQGASSPGEGRCGQP